LKHSILSRAKVIFWDFDGVIKESITIKSDAFEQLFLPFGEEIAKKVRKHHEINGGMSRFDKLPIYLKWAGQKLSVNLIDQFEKDFSLLVKHKVVDSEWVSGVLDYLLNNYHNQIFFLVTATPQQEIEEILRSLNIDHFFEKVFGSPTKKNDAIRMLLNEYSIIPNDALMIGDSVTDYKASKLNSIEFVLRKTKLNKILQKKLKCQMIYNFQL